MRLYFDTSAIVSIFVTEDRTADVRQLAADADATVIVSDLAHGEFGAAISTAVRTNRLSAPEGLEVLEDFDAWQEAVERIAVTGPDMRLGTSHARNFDLAVLFPDALHLALAARANATLVTDDRRQADVARKVGVAVTFV